MTQSTHIATATEWNQPWLSLLPQLRVPQLRQLIALRLWRDLIASADSKVFERCPQHQPDDFTVLVANQPSQPPLKLLCDLFSGNQEGINTVDSRRLQSLAIRHLAQRYALEVAEHPLLAYTDLGLPPEFWGQWQAVVLDNSGKAATPLPQIGCAEPYSAGLWLQRLGQPVTLQLVEPWQLNSFLVTKQAIGIHTGYLTDNLFDLTHAHELRQPQPEQPQDEHTIIQLCHSLFAETIARGASDLHLDSQPSGLVISTRQDGILREFFRLNPESGRLLVNRIKLLANLDITEQRRAQDGRISVIYSSQRQEIRVAALPTIQGEKTVLRFFDPHLLTRSLNGLHMPEHMLGKWKEMLNRRSGLLLSVGPTGSGKTSTLYSSIRHLTNQPIHICTVEDPVEIIDSSINQLQVDHQLGMNFATALKHLLRQDPDVIMVGEIRDTETAKVAVQAALTGHLVLASLHTMDAIHTIPRLIDLGVAPGLLHNTLNAILAQRLVRCTCTHCRSDTRSLCTVCDGTGYSGRRAVFELLVTDTALLESIQSTTELTKLLARRRHQSLWQAGMQLVQAGITTAEEVERVCPTGYDSPGYNAKKTTNPSPRVS